MGTNSCALGTAARRLGSNWSCVACGEGCNRCAWESDTQALPLICTECAEKYSWKGGDTREGFGGFQCVYSGGVAEKMFYHLIVVGVLFVAAALLETKLKANMLTGNWVVIVSYISLSACIFQLIYASIKKETAIIAVTATVIGVHCVANVCFFVVYFGKFKEEPGFKVWYKDHPNTALALMVCSLLFTFQTFRVLYSILSETFWNYDILLSSLKYFSCIQSLLAFSIFVIDIISLSDLSWGSMLYMTLIETFVLSVITLILLGYELYRANEVITEMKSEVRSKSRSNYVLGSVDTEREVPRYNSARSPSRVESANGS
eukprot:TRINITY_DN18865_c0_g1_i3.p1 TRINITY_DN18865_c0_g1~~TRINITY_DN18865_c0_g1_i3.p1  ORF type:complete len:318 (+),score=66.39 TRINITY_DN18865_c0_g1_i3:110-1063(+)